MDDDVAAAVEQLRREEGASLRTVVNQLLRVGLAQRRCPGRQGRPFRTDVADSGRALLPDVDNVSDVLDLVDPESGT